VWNFILNNINNDTQKEWRDTCGENEKYTTVRATDSIVKLTNQPTN